MHTQITDAAAALKFLTAGNSRVTLKSVATGTRYTYRIARAENQQGNTQSPFDLFFVSLLTGSDNESDYTYLGIITWGAFKLTRKSTMNADSAPVKAIVWALRALAAGKADGLEVWHEGRCGRCARPLTVPESIASGYGPECITKMH